MKENPKFALYARVSTFKGKKNGEDKSQDPELQLRDLRAYAEARGWTTKEYVDIGVSGVKDRRPQLDAMMEDARKRRIDGILTWKLDRLGRSVKHLILTLDELNSLGVGFVSFKESLDFTTPTGKLMFHLLAAFAEFERDLISQRVKAGIAYAQAKGKPYGRRSLIDTRLLNTVGGMRGQGMTIRGIAGQLNVSPSLVHKALKKIGQETLNFQGSENANSLFT